MLLVVVVAAVVVDEDEEEDEEDEEDDDEVEMFVLISFCLRVCVAAVDCSFTCCSVCTFVLFSSFKDITFVVSI